MSVAEDQRGPQGGGDQSAESSEVEDLAVGAEDARCDRALAHLAEFAPMFRNLGSYASTLLPRPTAAVPTVAAGDPA